MKPRKLLCSLMFIMTLLFNLSCKKEAQQPTKDTTADVSSGALDKIKKLGFSTHGVVRRDSGYVVEGDIFLSDADLNKTRAYAPTLRVANAEQYMTTYVVRSLPRVITVSVANLPAVYTTATDIAIARYNALGLLLTFQRVATGGDISIVHANMGDGALGLSGFPDVYGHPYNSIQLNSNANGLGSNPDQYYLATVIAHELGHSVGFRHTDYFNRSFSCGWSSSPNEGDGGIGAIPINGTPASEDPNSWMLACIGTGENRPFNPNDVTALRFLYGRSSGTQVIPDGTYKVTSLSSGKVLDVHGASTEDGGRVVQWGWNGGNNQQWSFGYMGNGYYRIISVNSGRSLDINNYSQEDGTPIIQYTWHDGFNQQWQITPNGDGSFTIQNRNSRKVLDVTGNSPDDGASIIQFTPNGGNNQRWRLEKL
ncbi:M57 family metalloprotease [Chitinophaga varians]|uniref:M57 family metalloprotease n=1 Tax=Chitinophaga varians TaxID=2202339 RepID=UPI00165FB5D6|nr:M57 family metalloprotease [Chitinophaga varians]MBC9909764.1 RICIN domain-containing protein [Chitinophaga varians]